VAGLRQRKAVGEKSFRNRGYSTVASSKFLTLAFRDLGPSKDVRWGKQSWDEMFIGYVLYTVPRRSGSR
jgi:hypothetical protein